MRIFVSYASEDRKLADQVQLALLGQGHDVFFDKDDLPPGGNYDELIAKQVDRSDLFVFLISPDSVSPGSYALTELKYARAKWPYPKGAVLPVMARSVPYELVPPYLAAVTVLEAEGNVPAETARAVSNLASRPRPPWRTAAGIGSAAALVLVGWLGYRLVGCGGETTVVTDVTPTPTSVVLNVATDPPPPVIKVDASAEAELVPPTCSNPENLSRGAHVVASHMEGEAAHTGAITDGTSINWNSHEQNGVWVEIALPFPSWVTRVELEPQVDAGVITNQVEGYTSSNNLPRLFGRESREGNMTEVHTIHVAENVGRDIVRVRVITEHWPGWVSWREITVYGCRE